MNVYDTRGVRERTLECAMKRKTEPSASKGTLKCAKPTVTRKGQKMKEMTAENAMFLLHGVYTCLR